LQRKVIEVNNSNEILHNALEECLEKEIKSIPEDSEIKKLYTPSSQFKEKMRPIIRREKAKERFKLVYPHRKLIYQLAATAAVLIIIIHAKNILISPKMDSDSSVDESMQTEMVSDEATTASEFAAPAGATEDSAAKSTMDAALTDGSIVNAAWSVEVTDESEATLRFENISNEAITYGNIFKVEKYENGNWVEVNQKEVKEESTLEPGEFIEESIVFEDFSIKEEGIYKLYRNVNNIPVTVDIEIVKQ